jgi:hypothetical protein
MVRVLAKAMASGRGVDLEEMLKVANQGKTPKGIRGEMRLMGKEIELLGDVALELANRAGRENDPGSDDEELAIGNLWADGNEGGAGEDEDGGKAGVGMTGFQVRLIGLRSS